MIKQIAWASLLALSAVGGVPIQAEPPTAVASAKPNPVPANDAKSGIPDIADTPFSARLVVSLDPDRAIEEYEKTGVVPHSDDRMTIDESLGAFYLMRGCQPDAEGNCNVTARSSIIKADGTVVSTLIPEWKAGDPSLIPLRIGAKPSSGRMIPKRMGSLNFSFLKLQAEFDPKKAVGDYLFLTTFTDNNSASKEETILWKAVRVEPAKLSDEAVLACKPLADSSGALSSSPASDNLLGYKFLYEKRDIKRAIALFQCNAATYPKLASALYDSLGEAYVAACDRQRAIQAYAKAVKAQTSKEDAAHAAGILTKLAIGTGCFPALQAELRHSYDESQKAQGKK